MREHRNGSLHGQRASPGSQITPVYASKPNGCLECRSRAELDLACLLSAQAHSP